MTKGQAYEKYGLSTKNANFNPDEVADSKFIEACKQLHRLRTNIIEEDIIKHHNQMVREHGKEETHEVEKASFFNALGFAIERGVLPAELALMFSILVDKGCPVLTIIETLDVMAEILDK